LSPPKAPAPVPTKKQEWWEKEGVRFECQGSGKCCVSRGEYGFVYMTGADRVAMAKSLKMKTRDFMDKYCEKTDGVWHIRETRANGDCVFLEGGNRCGVYEGRPQQCRTWPFWPEVMNAKTWKKEVSSFCPGIGKGRLYSPEEIREIVAKQAKSEGDLVNGR
jgi:Fe-S-cluster containining protein